MKVELNNMHKRKKTPQLTHYDNDYVHEEFYIEIQINITCTLLYILQIQVALEDSKLQKLLYSILWKIHKNIERSLPSDVVKMCVP